MADDDRVDGWTNRELDFYKIAIDIWKFNVTQYWTRSSYFVVFQTAGLGAAVYLLGRGADWRLLAWFAGFGAAISFVWLQINNRNHNYGQYWWLTAASLELIATPDGTLRTKPYAHMHRYENEGCSFDHQEGKQTVFKPAYKNNLFLKQGKLMQFVTGLFIAVWVCLGGWSCLKLHHATQATNGCQVTVSNGVWKIDVHSEH